MIRQGSKLGLGALTLAAVSLGAEACAALSMAVGFEQAEPLLVVLSLVSPVALFLAIAALARGRACARLALSVALLANLWLALAWFAWLAGTGPVYRLLEHWGVESD